MNLTKKIKLLYSNFSNWYLRPLERFGLVNGDITYRLRNGVSFTFKAKKTFTPFWILGDMVYNNTYNSDEVSVPDSGVIVDIGANVGFFSVLEANVFKNAKVYSYEPDPNNYKYLVKNVENNSQESRVKCFNCAVVGDENQKTVRLYLHEDDAGANSLYKDKIDEKITGFVDVPTQSLESIVKDNNIDVIDFLKLDCEGAEHEIIANSKAILPIIKFIALELHAITGTDNVVTMNILRENNFFVHEIKPTIFHCFNKKYCNKS